MLSRDIYENGDDEYNDKKNYNDDDNDSRNDLYQLNKDDV